VNNDTRGRDGGRARNVRIEHVHTQRYGRAVRGFDGVHDVR
jgi:hypothetical protein